MADVIVSADASYGPPRNVIVAHATGGSILESCEVTRIVGGVEEPIRRQPIVGVSDVTLYDYEAPYDRSAVYRIQGMERNTLASSWTGNKNASTSTLSQDGQVGATQMLTGTKALTLVASGATWGNGGWRTTGGGSTVNTDLSSPPVSGVTQGVMLTADPSASWAEAGIAQDGVPLQPGDYIYSLWVKGVNSAIARIAVSNGNTTVLNTNITCTGAWRLVALRTRVQQSDNFNVYCYNKSSTQPMYVCAPMVCTQSDWQMLQSLGVDWFDGDSFQAGTTTQYDESSSHVTLSPDSGWLIHPGNPAKSMRLPLGHITGMGDTTRRSNATRHDILGARYPIYTNPGPRYSRELSMKLRTRTADDENMLDALLDDQTPILFNPRGVDASRLNLNPMYLQVGDVTAARYAQSLYPTSDSPQHWRDWTLPCTQVDSPAVSQQAVGWTYAQLLNDNTRYQSVIISYKDYASLQAHSVKDGQ